MYHTNLMFEPLMFEQNFIPSTVWPWNWELFRAGRPCWSTFNHCQMWQSLQRHGTLSFPMHRLPMKPGEFWGVQWFKIRGKGLSWKRWCSCNGKVWHHSWSRFQWLTGMCNWVVISFLLTGHFSHHPLVRRSLLPPSEVFATWLLEYVERLVPSVGEIPKRTGIFLKHHSIVQGGASILWWFELQKGRFPLRYSAGCWRMLSPGAAQQSRSQTFRGVKSCGAGAKFYGAFLRPMRHSKGGA